MNPIRPSEQSADRSVVAPVKASNCVNMTALAMMTRITADKTAASPNARYIMRNDSFRLNAAVIKPPSTPVAAASEGVAMPN